MARPASTSSIGLAPETPSDWYRAIARAPFSRKNTITGPAGLSKGPRPRRESSAWGRGHYYFGSTLLENEELLADLDELIIDRIVSVVEGHRQQVADLIAETVAGWDPEATSQRMELAVGRDLQFVRINGTLVGGLVGLLIYAIPRLLR